MVPDRNTAPQTVSFSANGLSDRASQVADRLEDGWAPRSACAGHEGGATSTADVRHRGRVLAARGWRGPADRPVAETVAQTRGARA